VIDMNYDMVNARLWHALMNNIWYSATNFTNSTSHCLVAT